MNTGKSEMAQIKGSITVFPARAGVILSDRTFLSELYGLSRTSGGDPLEHLSYYDLNKSFPHERG